LVREDNDDDVMVNGQSNTEKVAKRGGVGKGAAAQGRQRSSAKMATGSAAGTSSSSSTLLWSRKRRKEAAAARYRAAVSQSTVEALAKAEKEAVKDAVWKVAAAERVIAWDAAVRSLFDLLDMDAK
jgi:hypothetical protein